MNYSNSQDRRFSIIETFFSLNFIILLLINNANARCRYRVFFTKDLVYMLRDGNEVYRVKEDSNQLNFT